MEQGLESYLSIKYGGNKASIISEEIHRKLSNNLNDSTAPIKRLLGGTTMGKR
ncbi:MAG: hypothetical protein ACWIPJ_08475 [Polaribacter sp.]